MLSRRRSQWVSVLFAGLALAVVTTGCSTPTQRNPVVAAGDGPLRALASGGGITGPAVRTGEATKTWTFGTELCSEVPEALIQIDQVRFDTSPPVRSTDRADGGPVVSAWLRVLPPGPDLPIGSFDGEPVELPGQVSPVSAGFALPVGQKCESEPGRARTRPVVELLTAVTVGEPGGVVEQTWIDYHVGANSYTLEVAWVVGLCGTSVPAGFGCRART